MYCIIGIAFKVTKVISSSKHSYYNKPHLIGSITIDCNSNFAMFNIVVSIVVALVVCQAVFVSANSVNGTVTGSNCGGNCPGGNCATCPCRTTSSMQSISTWCAKYSWNQANCQCIMKYESGGNANAVGQNTGGSYDVGLW